MSWCWRFDAVFAQTLQVKGDGALNTSQSRIDGFAGRNTPGKIRYGGSPIAIGVFVDANQILQLLHLFSPLSPAWRITDR